MDPSTPLSIRVNINGATTSQWTPNSPVSNPRRSEKVLRHKYGHVNPARFQADAANSIQRHLQGSNSERSTERRGFGAKGVFAVSENLDSSMDRSGEQRNYDQDSSIVSAFPQLTREGESDSRKRHLHTEPSFQRELNSQGAVASESGRKRRRTGDFSGPSTASNLTSPRIHAHRLSLQGSNVPSSTNHTSHPAISGLEISSHSQNPLFIRSTPATPTLRPSNIHATAALFRRSLSTAKKQTRPAMAKLFTSLELSPEDFLDLQAAAKAYMLDPAHPERRECVGSKGGGDADRVRLRLYNCVREFLNSEENLGERFFGVGSASGGDRKYVWPRDEVEVIEMCTPLLRRMVTNERQRRYALESRQGGARSRLSGGMESLNVSDETANEKEKSSPAQSLQRADRPVEKHANREVSLRLVILRTRNGNQEIVSRSSHILPASRQQGPGAQLVDLVHFACEQQGATPKYRNTLEYAAGLPGVVLLRALSPVSGLQDVGTEEELQKIIADVQHSTWMEDELRVVAEVQ